MTWRNTRDNIPDNTLKGTTTVALTCKDGVVLATDRRATMGYYVASKTARKLFRIDEHLAATIAGSVADAQRVMDSLQAETNIFKVRVGVPMRVKAAANLLSSILFEARLFPYLMEAVVGGIDETGPQLYALDPVGSLTTEKFVATGSGGPIAYGLLEDSYSEDLTVKDGIPLVIRAIRSSMERDAASGNGFDVAYITKSTYHELSESEIRKVSEELNAKKKKAHSS
ncbi:MAG: archaeal proteasome endopeptidase complex subunit beta [Promethearchaeati archaeon SRVP18_Atabeyarchaeia-1]